MTGVIKPKKTYTVILRDASDTYNIYVLSATSPEGATAYCIRIWEAHGGTSPTLEFIFEGEVEPIKGFGSFYERDKVIYLFEMDTDS